MSKNTGRGKKADGRKAFTVPAVSGDYAEERLTFGAVNSGTQADEFEEVTALAEGPLVAGATVELWLPRVRAGDKQHAELTDADYTLAGTNFATLTAAGAVRWLLSGWPGAQIRVKSGGIPGTQNVSAAAL